MANKEQSKLTTRQHLLKTFLENNFISGKFFSIYEICQSVHYSDGEPCYEYDDREITHDHCVALGNDVRAINECLVDGWKLIIKDKKGGVKLAESETEFKTWWDAEKKKVDDRAIKLNMMLSKAQDDGLMPIINKANNPVDPNKDLKPIEAYMRVETYEGDYISLAFINKTEKIIYFVEKVYKYKYYKADKDVYANNPYEQFEFSGIDEILNFNQFREHKEYYYKEWKWEKHTV